MKGALDLERASTRLARSINYNSLDIFALLSRYISLAKSACGSGDVIFNLLPEVQLVVQEEFLRPTDDNGKGDDLETLTKQLVNAVFGGATNQGGKQ